MRNFHILFNSKNIEIWKKKLKLLKMHLLSRADIIQVTRYTNKCIFHEFPNEYYYNHFPQNIYYNTAFISHITLDSANVKFSIVWELSMNCELPKNKSFKVHHKTLVRIFVWINQWKIENNSIKVLWPNYSEHHYEL